MKWENVYIFISSTFNDMHAERDYLVKRVFPELREWCNKRKLKMIDIDLRWGITEKDATENKRVVEVCLNNIDKCRPFFLCFMGQRRGWIPELPDVNERTIQKFPEIKSYLGKHSITELEIIHALIRPFDSTKTSVSHTLFYFRNPEYLEFISNPEIKEIFVKNEESFKELQKFKNQIAQNYSASNYDAIWNPIKYSTELRNINGKDLSNGRLEQFQVGEESLEAHVIRNLKEAIQEEFPDHFYEELEKDELEIELEKQDTFLFSICDSYISRKKQEEELCSYMQSRENRPMVLVANAGNGKTSLLANIIQNWNSTPLFYRFVGISAGSSDVTTTLQLLVEEICRKGWIERDVCENVKSDVLLEFSNILEKLDNRPCCIILDAIDQWSHVSKTALTWLPERIPSNVKLILSLKGETNPEIIKKLEKKHVKFCFMEGLKLREEKVRLIESYMAQFLKDIDDEQMETILNMEGSNNPLYLKVILNELRIHGSFDTLLETFNKNYGKNPEEAFGVLLERLEQEEFCGFVDSKTFTSYVLGIVANSLDGVEFSEWSYIFSKFVPECKAIESEEILDAVYAISKHLSLFMVIEDGRLNYLYDSFRRAVKARYDSQSQEFHSILADIYARYCNPNGEHTFSHAKSVDMRYLFYHTMTISAERIRGLITNAWFFYELLKKTSAIQVATLLIQSAERYSELQWCKVLASNMIRTASRLDNSPNLIFETLSDSAIAGQKDGLATDICRNAMEMELPYYCSVLSNEPWYHEADKELKIYTKRENELEVVIVGDYIVYSDDVLYDPDFFDKDEHQQKSSFYEIQNLETGEIERQVHIPKWFTEMKCVGEYLEVSRRISECRETNKWLMEYEMYSIPSMDKVGHREDIVEMEIVDNQRDGELLSLEDLFGNSIVYDMQVENILWEFTFCTENSSVISMEGAIYEIRDNERILKHQKTYPQEMMRYFDKILGFIVVDGYAYFLCEGAYIWAFDETLEWKAAVHIRNKEAESKNGISSERKYAPIMHSYKNYLVIMDRDHISFYDREKILKSYWSKRMPDKSLWGKLKPVVYKKRLYLMRKDLYAIDLDGLKVHKRYPKHSIIPNASKRYRIPMENGVMEECMLTTNIAYDEIKMYALKNMSEVFAAPVFIDSRHVIVYDYFFNKNRIGIVGRKTTEDKNELCVYYYEIGNKEAVEVWNLGIDKYYKTSTVWVVDNIPYLISVKEMQDKSDLGIVLYDLERKTEIACYTYNSFAECVYGRENFVWNDSIFFVMESIKIEKSESTYLINFNLKNKQWERMDLDKGDYIGNDSGLVFLQKGQEICIYSIETKTRIGVINTHTDKKCKYILKKENTFVVIFKDGLCKVFSESTYELLFEQYLEIKDAEVINCPGTNKICVLSQSQIYHIYDVVNTRQLGVRIQEEIERREKELTDLDLSDLFADD